ncbi:MAG: aminopeptidase P family protein, partial [Clostridia bacterium]|nr:aminopeptidase P family protein [Clostridia bacterium]
LDGISTLRKGLDGFNILTDNALSQKILKMRSIKDEEEIKSIEKAQVLTDEAFSYILSHIKPGVRETDIALKMEFFMREHGSEGVAFDFIVVSGKNSSLPHGVPTDKKIENGDFVTMDFGGVINGYRSDMTRTVAVGSVTPKQETVYETVLKAQKAALDAIKPEVPCSLIDKTARDIITAEGFGDCFGHGLGHSVGLEIHENPACNTRDTTLLKSGMIMTVEPGIYIPDKFGVRIEDMVLITDNGYKNFTKSPKELKVL